MGKMLDIKVFGTGCSNCKKLEDLCNQVVTENNFDASVEKVTDFQLFVENGILRTPGLMVNGKVLSQGKIPTRETLAHWLSDSVNNN